ncbi:hypothetical protein ABBQ38_009425 [Trebouxia sp. C0009 RCD-2024]
MPCLGAQALSAPIGLTNVQAQQQSATDRFHQHKVQELCTTRSTSLYGRRPALPTAFAFRQHTQYRGRHSATRPHRLAAAKSEEVSPPQPNSKFTPKDRRRIKQNGPTEKDLTEEYTLESENSEGQTVTEERQYVPPEVLGSMHYDDEPAWETMTQMPYMEFYDGLRQRNWTSPYHNPQAESWDLKFFRDSGRLFRPSWPGFRVQITKRDGSQCWADLPQAGAETFVKDHVQAAVPGTEAQLEQMRLPHRTGELFQYGYNQVFHQLFQAYEQHIPAAARQQFDKKGYVDLSKYKYRCPGESRVAMSFHLTPQEPSFAKYWDMVPIILFFSFAFSFLGVCLGLGIFRPRKMMPSDPIQAMEFAQSKGQAHKEGRTNVTLKDVAGLDATVGRLQQVVTYLRDPAGTQFRGLARPPKGILLEGDPGVGKTLIAKAIAGEAGVPFFQMSGSEFVEAIVGVGAARVRDLFKRARAQKEPCIIFVDEIDALGIKRAEAGMRTNEEREQTLNQLLTEMDGFVPGSGVVFMAATNRADLLDNALTRPGRFDWRIFISKPDQEGREAILKVHTRNRPMADDVNLSQVAQDLPGLSGAELANVMNEAALEAVRRNGSVINTADIYNAMDRILQGVRRPALPDYLEVRKYFAVHECGKALVATKLRQQTGRLEQVERVSIVPRGRDWTRTIFLRGDDEDYTMTTRGRMMERLQVILAGRAAEEVAYEIPSSYSISDLKDATQLALKIVTNYALSDIGITTYAPPGSALGYMRKSFEVSVDNIDADLFGRGVPGGSFQPSDDNMHNMRTQAIAMLQEAYDKDLAVLRQHSDALRQATLSILKTETLTGQELKDIMAQHPPQDPPRGQNGSGPNGGSPDTPDNMSGASEMDTLSTPVLAGPVGRLDL